MPPNNMSIVGRDAIGVYLADPVDSEVDLSLAAYQADYVHMSTAASDFTYVYSLNSIATGGGSPTGTILAVWRSSGPGNDYQLYQVGDAASCIFRPSLYTRALSFLAASVPFMAGRRLRPKQLPGTAFACTEHGGCAGHGLEEGGCPEH